MSTAAAALGLQALPARADLDGWAAYLADALATAGEWRPAEWDPASLVFTGDPDNPMITSERCRVPGCEAMVAARRMCAACERKLVSSGLAEAEFLAGYRPTAAHRRRTGETCVVARDGVCCQRRQISRRTGLCEVHSGQWHLFRRDGALSLAEWRAEVARPLLARPACLVAGCMSDARAEGGLCGLHFRAWRADLDERPESAERWAARQLGRLAANQFSLAPLSPTVRLELLWALRQRDAVEQRLDPEAVRGLVKALAAVSDLDSLTAVPLESVFDRFAKVPNVRAFARWAWRTIGLKFEEFRGISHVERDVWDCLALELEAPRRGRRPNQATIDFTPISQRWLREATKHWVRTMRPDTNTLQRAMQAATLASAALARRPGGGVCPEELGFADECAVFEAIKNAARADGQRYHSHFRRHLWARLWAVIELGRASGLLAELPAAFTRNSTQRIANDDPNEDHIGKAIPETVIAQLDAHLHLLEADHTYGQLWSAADTALMFRTAYEVLRDTGRRPGELVSLPVDCIERDGEDWSLVYDNHKQRRLRRRLPITTETAAVIGRWQERRATLDVPAVGQRWLFPAPNESSGPGHLTTNRLSRALGRWVAVVPVLHSDLPGPDGAPLPFDRSLIYPYAFRHSYAQRHADAGVGVEILKDLMDHKDMQVTQGYYTVSLKRKRQAIKIMSRYVHDRTGAPVAGPGSATAYELRSVAVPFGNCIEPTNVKAGGKACPVRFQCAGCGFYRPDPSYLPAIEEHINALKADRETAVAMDAQDFVVRNLGDQAVAFAEVADAMRGQLHALPDAERAEVEQASAVLRRLRASRGRTRLPLRVEDRP